MGFKSTFKNIATFAFTWLNLGFAIGFLVLMGPVRWLVNFCRNNHYADATENTLVKVVIVLFVIASFFAALYVASKIIKLKSIRVKLTALIVCLVFGVIALLQFLNPVNLTRFGTFTKGGEGEQFAFGSYPNKENLEDLKDEGFTTIISLLHPAVTPFEPILLKQEEKNCKEVGIELVKIPMLPWVSKNEESLEQIKQIALRPKGRYFIHCYLGKDRINLAKRVMGEHNNKIKNSAVVTGGRSLDSIKSFERGPITRIGNNVCFVPYPTEEEYTGYIIAGGVQNVISLMDSTDAEQQPRIAEERKLLATYNLPFYLVTIRSERDKQQIAQLKKLISTLSKPIIIHTFFSDKENDKKILEAIKR